MRHVYFLPAIAALFVSASCSPATDQQPVAPAAPSPVVAATSAPVTPTAPPVAPNPLVAKWSGPYGGLPPFAKVKVEQFKPALEAAMEEERRDVAAIAD